VVGIAVGGTVGAVVWRYERYCGMRPLCIIHCAAGGKPVGDLPIHPGE
jgi:hypothetical protein